MRIRSRRFLRGCGPIFTDRQRPRADWNVTVFADAQVDRSLAAPTAAVMAVIDAMGPRRGQTVPCTSLVGTHSGPWLDGPRGDYRHVPEIEDRRITGEHTF